MMKTKPGLEPLLRRPFSIFEIVRGRRWHAARHQHPEQAHRHRHRAVVRRPRRRPARVPRAARAAMATRGTAYHRMDGRRRRRARAVRHTGRGPARRGVSMRLFYGARRGEDSRTTPTGSRIAAWISCSPPRMAVAARTDGSTVPLDAALRAAPADQPIAIYCCGPTPMMQAVAQRAAAAAVTPGCRSSR